ncbi:MAG: hypothetical protein WCG02_00150 [Candidatus Taylorbacteria bacterium]
MKIHTDKHYMGRDPFIDWAVTVVFTCALAVVLIVVGVYSYRQIDARLADATRNPVVTKLPYDTRAVDSAINFLNDYAVSRDAAIKNSSKVMDPSI